MPAGKMYLSARRSKEPVKVVITKKKPAWRKRRVGKPTISRVLNGFASTMIVPHRYCELVAVPTTTAGLASAYAFRPNGLYDPNYSGAGHQPQNRDTFSTLFSYHCVLSSKIKVFFPPSSINYTGIVRYSEQLGSTSTVAEILESAELRPGNLKRINVGDKTIMASASYNARKNITGGADPTSDDRLLTAVGSNPAGTSGFIINTFAQDPTVTVPAIYVQVQIDYLVFWSGRVQQALN